MKILKRRRNRRFSLRLTKGTDIEVSLTLYIFKSLSNIGSCMYMYIIIRNKLVKINGEYQVLLIDILGEVDL